MSYFDARTAIAEVLRGVSITEPIDKTLTEVYEFRPDLGNVTKFPCAWVTGFASRTLRAHSMSETLYSIGIRLVVKPVGGAEMGELLDAFKEAIRTAFDAAVTLHLGGGYSLVEGPNWRNTEPEADGTSLWDEGDLIVKLTEAASFAP